MTVRIGNASHLKGKHDRSLREKSLLEAALAVFAERGYAAATTREIAERAGCAEALISRYFGGKRGLLSAVLEQKAQESLTELAKLPAQSSLQEEIEQTLLAQIEIFWERRDVMRIVVSQAIVDPQVAAVAGKLIERVRRDLVLERLQNQKNAGQIAEGVDLGLIAESISGVVFWSGFFRQVVFGADRRALRQAASQLARLIAGCIGANPNVSGS